MDLGNSKASDLERRLSRRSSVRLSVNVGEGGDGDGDGLDFSAATISDGFRPPQQSDATTDENETLPNARSAEPANPTETTSPPLPTRPSSIAKHPRPNDSFSLRHDGVMGPIEETASTHSSSSTTDSQPYIAPQSPYHGPSNPSHPYQMYMQNVRLARTPSVTTTSTTPLADSSFPDPRGPTHPYSMYPQGTTASESSTAPPTVIPVGFPGIPDQYQRRIGPEGEDIGDIIGPDGHTEQLPPYTRYPDEPYAAKGGAAEQSTAPAPAAVSSTAVANVAPPEASAPASAAGLTVPPAAVLATATATPAASATLAISQPIPGAGGIGLATRDPEFEATDDLDSPHSRHSLRSFASESSNRAINQAAAGAAVVSEKRGRLRGNHWGHRRLGGIIPYWAIGLAILALVLMSAVLGSVIGTFLAKHKQPRPSHDGDGAFDSMPSATISYDASPIPTPTDLPPLVTGEFSMPLMMNRISSTCFNDTQLSQAWSCNLLMFAGLSMVIEENLDTPEGGDYTISLTCNDTQTLGSFVYTYGEQPPLILDPLPMELVNDTLEPSRGPAWFKMLPYNKTVILHESQLQPPDGDDPPAEVRRNFNSFDGPGPGPGDIKRKGTARTGDRPWICTWPETLLEVFIYPVQNSSWARGPPPPPTSFPSMTSGTFTGGAPTPTTGEHPFGGDGGGGGNNPFGSHISDFDFPTPTSGSPASGETGGHFDGFPPPPYPRVVKVEERRVNDSPMATCRQVEVVGDGQPARPVKDAKGKDVVINIIENTPVAQSEEVKMVLERRGQYYNPLLRRDSSADLTSCGCIWFLT